MLTNVKYIYQPLLFHDKINFVSNEDVRKTDNIFVRCFGLPEEDVGEGTRRQDTDIIIFLVEMRHVITKFSVEIIM